MRTDAHRSRWLMIVALAAALAACGSDEPTDPLAFLDESGEPTVTAPEQVAPTPPSPSPSPSISSPTPTPTKTTPRRASTKPKAGSSLPPAAEPEQGETYWAAVITTSDDPEDPVLSTTTESLKTLGYDAQGGDIDCLQGARTFLELPADGVYSAVAVLFATEAQAKQFEKAFKGDLAGIGRVQAYCLDG